MDKIDFLFYSFLAFCFFLYHFFYFIFIAYKGLNNLENEEYDLLKENLEKIAYSWFHAICIFLGIFLVKFIFTKFFGS